MMLIDYLLWIKTLHLLAVISWMAGLLYLPRLFIYHIDYYEENTKIGSLFTLMQRRLFKIIMSPAMFVTWFTGLTMASIPGVVNWGDIWPWLKFCCVVVMSIMHFWMGSRISIISEGMNKISGRGFRYINEIPTFLMIIIIISVIVRPF